MLDDMRGPSPRTLGKRSRGEDRCNSSQSTEGDYSGHNVDLIDFHTPSQDTYFQRRVVYDTSPNTFTTTTPSPTNRNVAYPLEESIKSLLLASQTAAPALLPIDFSRVVNKFGAKVAPTTEVYHPAQLSSSPKDSTWGWFIEEDGNQ